MPTILINSSTYVIEPNEPFDISVENVWYIDDAENVLGGGVIQEQSELSSFTVPSDVYTTQSISMNNVNDSPVTLPSYTGTHKEIITSVASAVGLNEPIELNDHILQFLESGDKYSHRYLCYTLTWRDGVPASLDTTTKIMIPMRDYQWIHFNNMIIPHVKTFAITLDKSEITCCLSNTTLIYGGTDYIDKGYTTNTFPVPVDKYTFESFNTFVNNYHDLFYSNVILYTNTYYGNNFYTGYRYIDMLIGSEGYGVIYSVPPNYSETLSFNQPFVNRTIKVPEGDYTAETFCDYINNSGIFKSHSDPHYIYIDNDISFCFVPATVLDNEFMDKSTTFSKSKILMNHPQYQNITATVDGTTISGNYTPAELLRHISITFSNPVTVVGNVITFAKSITISSPYFTCNGTSVTNLCGLESFCNIDYSSSYLCDKTIHYDIYSKELIGTELIVNDNSAIYDCFVLTKYLSSNYSNITIDNSSYTIDIGSAKGILSLVIDITNNGSDPAIVTFNDKVIVVDKDLITYVNMFINSSSLIIKTTGSVTLYMTVKTPMTIV